MPAHAARRTTSVATRRLVGLVAVAVLGAGGFAIETADVFGATGPPPSAGAGSVVASTSTTAVSAAEQSVSPPPATPPRQHRPESPHDRTMAKSPSRLPHSPGGHRALSRQERHWQRVLDSLDRVRAQAWRQAKPGLLRQVYLPSAAEGARDRSMLREYAGRGLHVRGVSLAFGSVQVAHRAPGAVTLRVIDQLGAATAVDKQGRRLALPRDRPTRHTIELRRFLGGWRIADVRVR